MQSQSQASPDSYIEQRATSFGSQAYLRGTRVAVWQIAAILEGGYSAEEIVGQILPHLPLAAISAAIAYCDAHQNEIQAQLRDNQEEAVHAQLREMLSAEQYAHLTGQKV